MSPTVWSRKTIRQGVLKGIAYAVVLCVLHALQSVPGLFSIGGIKPMPLLCFAVCVAVLDSTAATVAVGACAGLLIDVGSGRVTGFTALFLLGLCLLLRGLFESVLRPSLGGAWLLGTGVIALIYLLDYLFFYALFGYEGIGLVLRRVTLPSMLYTAAILPLLYGLCLLLRRIAPAREGEAPA